MRRFLRYLLCAVSAMTTFSCQRQVLEDPYLFLAYVPVSVDWSESLLDLDEVGNISIYFYPKDGGEPIVKASDNLYFNLVEVPIGDYSVLIFNDLVNNVSGVSFNNESSYETFSVNMIEQTTSSPSYYDVDGDEVVVTSHSRMAAWYMDDLSVTESMVEYTRSLEFEEYISEVKSRAATRSEEYLNSSKSTDGGDVSEASTTKVELPVSSSAEVTTVSVKALEDLSNVVMPPETTIFNFRVRVLNLNNAMYFKAIVKGTANGCYLSKDYNISVDGSRHIYDILVDNREYDDPTNGIDGYVNFSLNTFGREPADECYDISFRIVLQSGELLEFERDITEQVMTSSGHTIEVDLTADLDMLILSEYQEAGFNVNSWGDKVTIYL